MIEKDKKIFIFDLDGTLIASDNQILRENISQLRTAKARGHILAVATGRSYFKTKDVLNQIPFFHYIFCNNGANIVDIQKNEQTLSDFISKDYFKQIAILAVKHDVIFQIDTEKGSYIVYNEEKHSKYVETNKMDFSTIQPVSWEEISAKILLDDEKIIQLALRSDFQTSQKIYDESVQLLSDNLSIVITNGVYVDYNVKGISKKIAIDFFREDSQFGDFKIFAFGDSDNDVPMLKNADYGIAMGNATKEAINSSDLQIGENTSDSIAQFLKDLI